MPSQRMAEQSQYMFLCPARLQPICMDVDIEIDDIDNAFDCLDVFCELMHDDAPRNPDDKTRHFVVHNMFLELALITSCKIPITEIALHFAWPVEQVISSYNQFISGWTAYAAIDFYETYENIVAQEILICYVDPDEDDEPSPVFAAPVFITAAPTTASSAVAKKNRRRKNRHKTPLTTPPIHLDMTETNWKTALLTNLDETETIHGPSNLSTSAIDELQSTKVPLANVSDIIDNPVLATPRVPTQSNAMLLETAYRQTQHQALTFTDKISDALATNDTANLSAYTQGFSDNSLLSLKSSVEAPSDFANLSRLSLPSKSSVKLPSVLLEALVSRKPLVVENLSPAATIDAKNFFFCKNLQEQIEAPLAIDRDISSDILSKSSTKTTIDENLPSSTSDIEATSNLSAVFSVNLSTTKRLPYDYDLSFLLELVFTILALCEQLYQLVPKRLAFKSDTSSPNLTSVPLTSPIDRHHTARFSTLPDFALDLLVNLRLASKDMISQIFDQLLCIWFSFILGLPPELSEKTIRLFFTCACEVYPLGNLHSTLLTTVFNPVMPVSNQLGINFKDKFGVTVSFKDFGVFVSFANFGVLMSFDKLGVPDSFGNLTRPVPRCYHLLDSNCIDETSLQFDDDNPFLTSKNSIFLLQTLVVFVPDHLRFKTHLFAPTVTSYKSTAGSLTSRIGIGTKLCIPSRAPTSAYRTGYSATFFRPRVLLF